MAEISLVCALATGAQSTPEYLALFACLEADYPVFLFARGRCSSGHGLAVRLCFLCVVALELAAFLPLYSTLTVFTELSNPASKRSEKHLKQTRGLFRILHLQCALLNSRQGKTSRPNLF